MRDLFKAVFRAPTHSMGITIIFQILFTTIEMIISNEIILPETAYININMQTLKTVVNKFS